MSFEFVKLRLFASRHKQAKKTDISNNIVSFVRFSVHFYSQTCKKKLSGMVNIDTCCFDVNEAYAKPNLGKFDKVTRQTPELSRTYYEAKGITTGLNKITYMPETGVVTFDVSGKLLPVEHRQLISQANIEACFDVINGTGVVEADCMSALENSVVRRVDFTENIHVLNVAEYLSALSAVSSPRYNKDVFNGRGVNEGKTGVVFRGTYKTFKEHLLFYDKQAETKDEAYVGVLRVESKRANFDAIRKDVRGDNSLLDILTSAEKPVLRVYSRVTGLNEANVKLYDRMKHITDIKQLYYEALLQQAGDDMQTVRQYLILANKDKRRANVNEHLRRIEAYRRQREAGACTHDYLQDILLKLSA